MNNGIEITSTQQPLTWSAVKALITFLAVLLLTGSAFGLMVYYVISKTQDAIVLTIMACALGLGVILAAVSVAGAAVYFVRRMGMALTEQTANNQQQLTNAFVQLVQETRESRRQNEQFVATVLRQANQSAPLQLTGTAREPRRFELGKFEDVDSDGRDDDDIVEVWVRQGNQYRKVEHSFTLLDDFIRMANPNRDLWQHANEKYGHTACIIEAIDGSPLTREGNSWKWRVPHDQVMAWWQRAQQTGSDNNGNR